MPLATKEPSPELGIGADTSGEFDIHGKTIDYVKVS